MTVPRGILRWVGLALLSVPVTASAQWSPITLTPEGTADPVRVDDTGVAHVVASSSTDSTPVTFTGFQRPRGGQWTSVGPAEPPALPPTNDFTIASAENAAGTRAVLSVQHGTRALVVHVLVAGRWQPPHTLIADHRDRTRFELSITDVGEIVVTWSAPRSTSAPGVWVATRSARGTWAPAIRLSREPWPVVTHAVNASGDTIVVWRRPTRAGLVLVSRQRLARRPWSAPATSRPVSGELARASVVLDTTGRAHLLWLRDRGSAVDLLVSSKPWTSSSWPRPVRLGAQPFGFDGFGVEVDGAGNALVGWGDSRRRIPHYSRFTPSGGWTGPRQVGRSPAYVTVFVSRFGRALIVHSCALTGKDPELATAFVKLPTLRFPSLDPLSEPDRERCPTINRIEGNAAGDLVLVTTTPGSNNNSPTIARMADGPATAAVTTVEPIGRNLAVRATAAGRSLVTLRRPALRHIAVAFFARVAVGDNLISIPRTVEGRRVKGLYEATVETGSRNPATRSASAMIALP